MKILAIETSCDETAVSIVEITETPTGTQARVLGNALYSQAPLHEQYGGVYPNLAKREHAKNLGPLLLQALKEAGCYKETIQPLSPAAMVALQGYLTREPELFKALIEMVTALERPDIDAIAVTEGPGLEPALWVGINGAKALAHVWNLPVIPSNHMEGHVFSSVLQKRDEHQFSVPPMNFPALALLISGGHTELVLVKDWGAYERIGETRDDAVGEAFDKVARMLGLPYPGGPQISKYAHAARKENRTPRIELPRPMLGSDDYDFSFSGLKTAVRYFVEKLSEVTDEIRQEVALAFEQAVGDVLLAKTKRAMDAYGVQTFIMGGGVSANAYLRAHFKEKLSAQYPETALFIPDASLTTDNAVMIAMAGYYRSRYSASLPAPESIRAAGNLKL